MSRLSGEMAMFCEQCGIHRDQLGDESIAPIRECRSCHRAICSNCWNLVVDACLRCAPFGLSPIAGRVPVVIPKTVADNAGLTPATTPFVGEPSVKHTAVTPTSKQSSAATKLKRPRRTKPAAASVVSEPSWPTHQDGPTIRDRTDQVHWDPLPQPSTVGGRRLAMAPRHVGISATGVAAVAVAVVAVGMLVAVLGSGPGTLAGGAPPTAPAPSGMEVGAGSSDPSAGPVTRVSSEPMSPPTADDVLTATPVPHPNDPPTNPGAATTPGPASTASARPTATAGATPTPTADPTPTPTAEPTPTPTPTAEPTPDPTPEPTPDPTPEPTPDPTPEPTPDPTPEPTPTVDPL